MPLRIGGRLNPKALKLAEAAFSEDFEIAAILDGPPPEVPPPAPNITRDFALGAFDGAVTTLKQLMSKSAAPFDSSVHVSDLEAVESFIRAVADEARKAATRKENKYGYAHAS